MRRISPQLILTQLISLGPPWLFSEDAESEQNRGASEMKLSLQQLKEETCKNCSQ